MNNEQIIQKIKNEKLKPISRSIFLFKKIIVWFLLIAATIFGSYAFAFFFLKSLYIDFDDWYYFSNSYNKFLIQNIPIIWIILFLFSIILMFYLFKRTNRGYKYSVMLIAFISLCISFLLGISLAKVLAIKSVLIDRFENERMMNWTNPGSGRLSGEILFIDDTYLLLRDIRDEVWNVNIEYLPNDFKLSLNKDDIVSIVGKYDYENNFTACKIMSFDIDNRHFKPNSKNKFKPEMNDNETVRDICDFVIKYK